MLWIFATLVAAGAQTARNAMQSGLTSTLGTLGATQVRFIYGLPFACVFLVAAATLAGANVPAPTSGFLTYTAAGGLAQIAGTALLLAAMRTRSFSVATAFNKTEAVQVAVFGVLILGDALTMARVVAIGVATANVRTLGLVEVLFAQVVARRMFDQRATPREAAGMALVVLGVGLLLLSL